MNELEKLREWQMEASRVLSNLYDTYNEGPHYEDDECQPVQHEVGEEIVSIKLLLESAPLHYRRLR